MRILYDNRTPSRQVISAPVLLQYDNLHQQQQEVGGTTKITEQTRRPASAEIVRHHKTTPP